MTKRGIGPRCKTMSSTEPLVFLFLKHTMFARPFVCLSCKRPVIRLPTQTQIQYLHVSPPLALPRRKDFFSSNAHLKQKQNNKDEPIEFSPDTQKQRRRGSQVTSSSHFIAASSGRSTEVEGWHSLQGAPQRARFISD
jgi:hypothetical protein